ncbi:MAG: SAM-dependent methyltransferase [Rhodospirillales bacterium]|nr:SAM-dependent methyltransferase [Rhodospirillales bacterium]
MISMGVSPFFRTLRGLGRWRGSPNRFQPFNHTLPDRYPWLFSFARETLSDGPERSLLSFGCSTGDEVFTLRRYFPAAAIKGIDIDPRNIAECRRQARRFGRTDFEFTAGDSTKMEAAQSYDAIFCLAVLCNGNLTTSGAERCDPVLRFATFERVVKDFVRCLKPGGLLCLVTTNFRFCDTDAAAEFDVALNIDPSLLAPDVLFDRSNRLMKNVRYTEVAFRKH